VVAGMVEEWNPILSTNWESFSVKVFLDSLANYLVWHKKAKLGKNCVLHRMANRYVKFSWAMSESGLAEKGQEDKYILSRKKMEMLVRYKKTSKTTNFTDLNESQKEVLFGERGMA